MIDLATDELLARYRRMRKAAAESQRSMPDSREWDTRPFRVEQDRRDEALEWPVGR